MITRFEIIDHRKGAPEPARKVIVSPVRSDHPNTKVTYQIQDDGQTLKVFLSDGKSVEQLNKALSDLRQEIWEANQFVSIPELEKYMRSVLREIENDDY
jgi:hypothetical protein